MKTINGKLSFGVKAVVSGQKTSVVNADPILIANSTAGKFTITPPVSKILGVASGDYVQFFNNISSIEAAIADRNEDLVTWCADNGLDIESYEGQKAIVKEFGAWYVAKGVELFDAKGAPKMVSERVSKESKLEYLKENAAAIVEANRDALLERLGVEDATDEELIASLTIEDVASPLVPEFSGSKASNVSGMVGVGVQVTFTDSSIWNTLKEDLGDDKTNINRVFDVLLEEPEMLEFHNGKETIEVRALPFAFKEDAEPAKKKSSKDAPVANSTAADTADFAYEDIEA